MDVVPAGTYDRRISTMSTRQILAVGLAVAMATAAMPISLAAQQTATISGEAKKEAKKPYTDYTTRARNVMGGQIAGTVMLDTNANFSLTGLPPANYVVELLDHNGKVVCTEGPFDLTGRMLTKTDVKISCNKVPAAWWLLGAAAAAGITAGVLAGGAASPSQ
jgi:hypothetical protein